MWLCAYLYYTHVHTDLCVRTVMPFSDIYVEVVVLMAVASSRVL